MPGIYDYPGEYRIKSEGEAEVKSAGQFHSFDYSAGARTLVIHRLSLPLQSSLLHWLRTATPAGGSGRNIVLEGLSRSGTPITRWKVRNARPTRYTITPRASKNEVSIETLEIVHEGLE